MKTITQSGSSSCWQSAIQRLFDGKLHVHSLARFLFIVWYCCVRAVCAYDTQCDGNITFPPILLALGSAGFSSLCLCHTLCTAHRQNTHSTSEFFGGSASISSKLRCVFVRFGKTSDMRSASMCIGVLSYGFWFLFCSLHSICSNSGENNDYDTPEWLQLCSHQTLFICVGHACFRSFGMSRCAPSALKHFDLRSVALRMLHVTSH